MEDSIVPPCFMCGKGLESAMPGSPNQPHSGTAFSARGNYGSGVWDPIMDHRAHLEINVCDGCMLLHPERVISVTEIPAFPSYEVELWDPESTPF